MPGRTKGSVNRGYQPLLDAVTRWVATSPHLTLEAVHRKLKETFPDGSTFPSDATINRWMAQARDRHDTALAGSEHAPRLSAPWVMEKSQPVEARHVLRVLRWLMLNGEEQITVAQGAWIGALAEAIPSLATEEHVGDLCHLALAFAWYDQQGWDRRSLDSFAACTPWLDGGRFYATMIFARATVGPAPFVTAPSTLAVVLELMQGSGPLTDPIRRAVERLEREYFGTDQQVPAERVADFEARLAALARGEVA